MAVACNAFTGGDSDKASQAAAPGSTTSTAARGAATSEPTVPVCDRPADGYDGSSSCYPGGELVAVASVDDGDAVKLADGRAIQLLGIDAPELDACGGPEAAQQLSSKVIDKPVLLHREPGRDLDRDGRLLGYLQSGERYVHTDIGNGLVEDGWATPYEPYAGSTKYMSALQANYKTAKQLHQGQFGPPCGPPYASIGGSGSGSGGVDLDYHHDRGLPDGALTGDYCARKWWC